MQLQSTACGILCPSTSALWWLTSCPGSSSYGDSVSIPRPSTAAARHRGQSQPAGGRVSMAAMPPPLTNSQRNFPQAAGVATPFGRNGRPVRPLEGLRGVIMASDTSGDRPQLLALPLPGMLYWPVAATPLEHGGSLTVCRRPVVPAPSTGHFCRLGRLYSLLLLLFATPPWAWYHGCPT